MIVGCAALKSGDYSGKTPTDLMIEVLNLACSDAQISKHQLQGIYTNVTLADTNGFQASHLAQMAGIIPTKDGRVMICKQIAGGGSSGVQGVIEAYHAIQRGEIDVATVVTADLSLSLDTHLMIENIAKMIDPKDPQPVQPMVPRLYNRIAEWHIKTYGSTRQQLAMTSVAMARQAKNHPLALAYGKTITLDKVLSSPQLAPVTTLYECSRRADGATAVIIVSTKFWNAHIKKFPFAPTPINIIGYGEASGFLRPPDGNVIREDMFPLKHAAAKAYKTSGKTVIDINFFGLYDCFPITLIMAVEHVGLVAMGKGGNFWEDVYRRNPGKDKPLKINTHGGLMHFGAPGSATSLINVVEAVQQMRGEALGTQVPNVKTALCYGSGGILTHAAVIILELAKRPKL